MELVKIGDPVEVLCVDGSDLSQPVETWVPGTCCADQKSRDSRGEIGVAFADGSRRMVRWPGWRRANSKGKGESLG